MSKLYMTSTGVACFWNEETMKSYVARCKRKFGDSYVPLYPVKILAGPGGDDDDNSEEASEPDN